jgi:YesN/AraC family two-component response regulator
MAKILLIDDEEIIRRRMKEILDMNEHETFVAENGSHGLETGRNRARLVNL